MTQSNVHNTRRAALAAEAARFKASGLNGLQVAAAMGLSRSYANELLVDPAGDKVRLRRREYAERHSGKCVDCGRRVMSYKGPDPPKRCADCHTQVVQDPEYWAQTHTLPRRYSDDDFLQHVRRCHAQQGRASTTAYLAYKADHPDAPTLRSIAIRFGSWWSAVERAGFKPGPNRRGPGRFPGEVCLAAIRQVAAALKKRPSIRAYDRYRSEHPDAGLPCVAQVRGHFDNSWIAAVDAALKDGAIE